MIGIVEGTSPVSALDEEKMTGYACECFESTRFDIAVKRHVKLSFQELQDLGTRIEFSVQEKSCVPIDAFGFLVSIVSMV